MEIDGEDYILNDVKYKYVVEGDVVFYTTILNLGRKKPYVNEDEYKDILRKYLNENIDPKKWKY